MVTQDEDIWWCVLLTDDKMLRWVKIAVRSVSTWGWHKNIVIYQLHYRHYLKIWGQFPIITPSDFWWVRYGMLVEENVMKMNVTLDRRLWIWRNLWLICLLLMLTVKYVNNVINVVLEPMTNWHSVTPCAIQLSGRFPHEPGHQPLSDGTS